MFQILIDKIVKSLGFVVLLAAILFASDPTLSHAQANNYLDRFNGSVLSTFGKQPVDASTQTNITLSGYQTIDNVALTSDYMRVLVKNQTDPTTNGVYTVFSSQWLRSSDFAGPSGTVSGQLIYVTGGTQAGLWQLTTPNPVQIDQSGGQSTSPSNITFAYAPFLLTTTHSTTSNTIGTGTKNFTTTSTLPATVGMYVLVTETSNPSNQMFAQITSYNGGVLGLNVTSSTGSGTFTDWTISVSGPQGAAGTTGATGPAGPTGPASTPYTQISISTTTTAVSNNYYVATGALTFNIPHSTTLNHNFSVILFAQGGAVTIGINAADKLNNGTTGAGGTLPAGSLSIITTDAGGNIYASALSAVSNAMLATMTNNTIKSNISGSTATPSDNTLSAILDAIFGNTQGALIYRGVSTWGILSPGTAGNLLQTGGAAANPSWVSPPAGGAWTLISTTVPSGGANNVIIQIPGGYNMYKILYTGVNETSNAITTELRLLVSTNSGASFFTTGYKNATGGSTTYIDLGPITSFNNNAAGGQGEIYCAFSSIAIVQCQVNSSATIISASGGFTGITQFSDAGVIEQFGVNSIQIAFTVSTPMGGQFNLYGISGT